MRIAINNAIGLLEECLHNGDKGLVALQGWFLGERNLIEQTILDLSEIENQQDDAADGAICGCHSETRKQCMFWDGNGFCVHPPR